MNLHNQEGPDLKYILNTVAGRQAIDKRNQNIIRSILQSAPPANLSQAEEKARTFYKSCVAERETVVSEDLINLQVSLRPPTIVELIWGKSFRKKRLLL